MFETRLCTNGSPDRLRFCEFARACVDHNLAGKHPEIYYFGCLSKEQKDVVTMITEKLYKFWDGSNLAPPRNRPATTTTQEQPALSILAWHAGGPRWPSSLTEKFAVGTPQYLALQELKKEFETMFPTSTRPTPSPTSQSANAPRASGSCDFSIEDGREPLDVHREVSLASIGSDAAEIAEAQRRSFRWSMYQSIDLPMYDLPMFFQKKFE